MAKDLLDKAAVMQAYTERLKAGQLIERPIAGGVLKIKAKFGNLLPAKPPSERGQGRNENKSSEAGSLDFSNHTIAAYRKLAKNVGKLETYYEVLDEVTT